LRFLKESLHLNALKLSREQIWRLGYDFKNALSCQVERRAHCRPLAFGHSPLGYLKRRQEPIYKLCGTGWEADDRKGDGSALIDKISGQSTESLEKVIHRIKK
jgi:hypothetical protein